MSYVVQRLRQICLGWILIVVPSAVAVAQTLQVNTFPVGLKPLGVDITSFNDAARVSHLYAVVANSGDNSVSIVELQIAAGSGFKIPMLTTTVATCQDPTRWHSVATQTSARNCW